MAAGFSVKDALNKNSKAGIDESPRARFRTKDISIFKMYRNDMNFYSVEQIEELAGDILMYGLKQNLELVYAPCDKGEYRIVAGERRWEALKYLVSKGYKEFELATSKLTTPQDDDEEQVEIIIANAYRTKTVSDMIEEETRLKASLERMKAAGKKIKGYDLQSGRLREVISSMLHMSKKWLDSYDGKKFFVLKMDVHHFFESINRRILKRKLKEVIRDKRFYRLLCILIEHDKIALVAKILTDAGVEIDAEQTKTLVGCIAFDDISGALEILQEIGITGAMFDELKEIIEEMRKGVPLGYFTSQWFGNFYLKALDHYIKEELHAEHYMRYMDDMVILGKSKKKLHKIHAAIETYLNDNLDLEIKGDWQVFRFEYPVFDKGGNPVLDKDRKQVTKGRMLDFMGFQFHHDRTTIRKSNIEAARRKANHISKQDKISWYNASVIRR